ncbi:MAG: DUF2141 domain-containing protein [Alphaproteobacteria bacterium]|nr:DUF2141 domain-containing protein [Alphaproteobacteria bacterium]MBV9370797.1 DUF2141 domain-containing protein [Alphaproteobacteria bacterium]MBV9900123.1 DUF2141 domain-containing protein [Alphaproteobacteria bacterium]
MCRRLALALLPSLLANAPAAELDVTVERLRNAKGDLQLCLTREAAHFPDCRGDPKAVFRTVPATVRTVRFSGLAPGGYALSVFHDENRNRKLDMALMIPREGFGFSRNPVVRFGAPKFRQVRIDLPPGISRQQVRMQYVL